MQPLIIITGNNGATKIATMKRLAQLGWTRRPYLINLDSYHLQFLSNDNSSKTPDRETVLRKMILRMRVLYLDYRPVLVNCTDSASNVKKICESANLQGVTVVDTTNHDDPVKLANQVFRKAMEYVGCSFPHVCSH